MIYTNDRFAFYMAELLQWCCFNFLMHVEVTDIVILHHFKSHFQITNGDFGKAVDITTV